MSIDKQKQILKPHKKRRGEEREEKGNSIQVWYEICHNNYQESKIIMMTTEQRKKGKKKP